MVYTPVGFFQLLTPGGTFTGFLNSWLGEPDVTPRASVVSDDLLVARLARDSFSHGSHFDGIAHLGHNKNTITILLNNCKWRLFVCRRQFFFSPLSTTLTLSPS